jgi:hypothetical protein
LVPAPVAAPTASGLAAPAAMAACTTLAPTFRQAQTSGPLSTGAPGGRPNSRAERASWLSTGSANSSASQSRGGRRPLMVTYSTATSRPSRSQASRRAPVAASS